MARVHLLTVRAGRIFGCADRQLHLRPGNERAAVTRWERPCSSCWRHGVDSSRHRTAGPGRHGAEHLGSRYSDLRSGPADERSGERRCGACGSRYAGGRHGKRRRLAGAASLGVRGCGCGEPVRIGPAVYVFPDVCRNGGSFADAAVEQRKGLEGSQESQ